MQTNLQYSCIAPVKGKVSDDHVAIGNTHYFRAFFIYCYYWMKCFRTGFFMVSPKLVAWIYCDHCVLDAIVNIMYMLVGTVFLLQSYFQALRFGLSICASFLCAMLIYNKVKSYHAYESLQGPL